MSKPNKRRYKLSAVVATVRKDHPPIEIEMDNGEVFTVDPVELWPDAALDKNTDAVESARAVMGDQYDAFVAAGGSAAVLNAVVKQEIAAQGITLGE